MLLHESILNTLELPKTGNWHRYGTAIIRYENSEYSFPYILSFNNRRMFFLQVKRNFLKAKESLCNARDPSSIPWRREKATHSSILAQRIPWTVQLTKSCKESDTTEGCSQEIKDVLKGSKMSWIIALFLSKEKQILKFNTTSKHFISLPNCHNH